MTIQPGLFDDTDPLPVAPVAEGIGPALLDWARSRPKPATRVTAPRTYAEDLIEQIVRDSQTLRMPSEFHAPSRAFYEERIEENKKELERIR